MEQRIRLTLAESRAGPPSKGIIDINVIDILFTGINSNSWLFDTGSVAHICNMMLGLRKMRKLEKGEMTMRIGNGVHLDAKAVGVVTLRLPSGFTLELNKCYFGFPSCVRT